MNSDAKVLLLYVQGLPESATDRPLGELASKLELKGRSYQQAKKQLVERGFLHEWRAQGDGGRWTTEQLLTNTPLTRDEARALRAKFSSDAGRELRAEPPRSPPCAQSPTVGEPSPRSAGGYEPEEEHGDKTTPHPPFEAERKLRPQPQAQPQLQPQTQPGSDSEEDQERPPGPVGPASPASPASPVQSAATPPAPSGPPEAPPPPVAR